MTGLTLVFHLVELLAHGRLSRSKALFAGKLHVHRGALKNQADVVGQNIGLPVGYVELRHAEGQGGAQCLGVLQELRNPVVLRAAALEGEIGSERLTLAVEAMALGALETLEEFSKFTGGTELRM